VLDLGFDFCGDRACFLGVIPGQTTWDETLQRLGSRGFINYGATITYPVTDAAVTLDRLERDGPIGRIQIVGVTEKSLPALQNFIAAWGSPCAVRVTNSFDNLLLIYPFAELSVDLDYLHYQRMRFNTRVTKVILKNYEYTFNVCEDQGSQTYLLIQWSGFASLDKYWADGLPKPRLVPLVP
jgi:hypothetical protein